MDYYLLLTNPAFAALVGGLAGVAGTHLTARFTARATSAPNIQASITAAVAGIMAHYQEALAVSSSQTTALRSEIEALHKTVDAQTETIARLEATVDAQTETIGSLETHIDELTTLMSAAGVTPPARRKRA